MAARDKAPHGWDEVHVDKAHEGWEERCHSLSVFVPRESSDDRGMSEMACLGTLGTEKG